jgi:DNA-binding MarR family transcriptional regulator
MKATPPQTARKSKNELVEEIVGKLMRRHSITVVLFHHALAERLGIGPTDHKCLDLLRERGTITGSELAALTGLTTGAVTGIVARLEKLGFLCREPDPYDGRKQILKLARERMRDLHTVFNPLRKDMTTLLGSFDARQLTAIAGFLARSTDLVRRHAALLGAETLHGESGLAGRRQPPRSGGRSGK